MKTVVLDGNTLTSIKEVHELFARELGFPAYYGRTLDALNDCLTDCAEPVQVVLRAEARMADALGGRGRALLRLLAHAEQEFPQISVVHEDAPDGVE